MFKLRLGLLVAVFLALVAACSSRNPQAPGKISGHVTYKGSPVPAGSIAFHSSEGKGVYGCPLGSDGAYEILDLPAGAMVVTVETDSVNPKKAPDYPGAKKAGKGAQLDAERLAAEGKGKQAPSGPYVKIPAKYGDPKTSPLNVTIEAGKQVKEFELTD